LNSLSCYVVACMRVISLQLQWVFMLCATSSVRFFMIVARLAQAHAHTMRAVTEQ
jgi:hypothetical protein